MYLLTDTDTTAGTQYGNYYGDGWGIGFGNSRRGAGYGCGLDNPILVGDGTGGGGGERFDKGDGWFGDGLGAGHLSAWRLANGILISEWANQRVVFVGGGQWSY